MMIYATYGCCFYALAYHDDDDDDDDGRKTNDDESLTQHMVADVATHALVANAYRQSLQSHLLNK